MTNIHHKQGRSRDQTGHRGGTQSARKSSHNRHPCTICPLALLRVVESRAGSHRRAANKPHTHCPSTCPCTPARNPGGKVCGCRVVGLAPHAGVHSTALWHVLKSNWLPGQLPLTTMIQHLGMAGKSPAHHVPMQNPSTNQNPNLESQLITHWDSI